MQIPCQFSVKLNNIHGKISKALRLSRKPAQITLALELLVIQDQLAKIPATLKGLRR